MSPQTIKNLQYTPFVLQKENMPLIYFFQQDKNTPRNSKKEKKRKCSGSCKDPWPLYWVW
jgi:hypothetical protein